MLCWNLIGGLYVLWLHIIVVLCFMFISNFILPFGRILSLAPAMYRRQYSVRATIFKISLAVFHNRNLVLTTFLHVRIEDTFGKPINNAARFGYAEH